MVKLVEPGVTVTIIDESFYIPVEPEPITYEIDGPFMVASATNKGGPVYELPGKIYHKIDSGYFYTPYIPLDISAVPAPTEKTTGYTGNVNMEEWQPPAGPEKGLIEGLNGTSAGDVRRDLRRQVEEATRKLEATWSVEDMMDLANKTHVDMEHELATILAEEIAKEQVRLVLQREDEGFQMLLGSSIQPATQMIGHREVQLGELVNRAFKSSGLTNANWNALEEHERENWIHSAVMDMWREEGDRLMQEGKKLMEEMKAKWDEPVSPQIVAGYNHRNEANTPRSLPPGCFPDSDGKVSL